MDLNKFFPIVIVFGGLFLTTIVIGNNLSQRILEAPSPSPSPLPEFSKLQICPDAWYKNEMPCVYRDSPAECEKVRKEYLIINGERKELEEVDVQWIKKNCEVSEPEVVY